MPIRLNVVMVSVVMLSVVAPFGNGVLKPTKEEHLTEAFDRSHPQILDMVEKTSE
jgi:hypothetical protein